MINKVIIILKIIISSILLQTLFFKFSAAPESVYIFSKIGMEPYGRIGSGVAELFAVLLLVWSQTTVVGALLSLVIMSAALCFHVTKLGIVVMDDSGLLFILALVVLISSILILYLKKDEWVPWVKLIWKRNGKQ
ncbi:DoxX family protein [Leptospira sp. 201903074]|uniref:DoxX family protein n=1 Tax=Leptospira abararensis TaxID=2810036 RepID=UPI0019655226|nr:DoxX family protein [Leptospira abararensis]MBM9546858.1 DoxX family protein [Leptospira abararensis]